jgi:hypothetical protein
LNITYGENNETVTRLILYRLRTYELRRICFHAWHGRIFYALIFVRYKDTILRMTSILQAAPICLTKLVGKYLLPL